MTNQSDAAERAYAQAATSLLPDADNEGLADRITTLDEYRTAYEAVRSELLEAYDELEGPVIGDLLADAARDVWPAVVSEL